MKKGILNFIQTTLPWNDSVSIISTGNLYGYITMKLPTFLHHHVPRTVTLFFDLEISETVVLRFLDEMLTYLEQELVIRKQRRDKFIKLGLFTRSELDGFLFGKRDVLPWAIYYSKNGGLGVLTGEDEARYERGIIPCSTMRHHGVAWKRNSNGNYRVWLATARQEYHDWHWDSDIGHESAHAAFAPLPLYTQVVQDYADKVQLSTPTQIENLEPLQLVRMTYMYSEISVVAVRGEQRKTETGLPIADAQEFYALLLLSNQLMPHLGFDRALNVYKNMNGFVDVKQGDEIFYLAAPAMRVTNHFNEITYNYDIPSVDWFRSI